MARGNLTYFEKRGRVYVDLRDLEGFLHQVIAEAPEGDGAQALRDLIQALRRLTDGA